MISRRLARRLEALESRMRPVDAEPLVIRLNFVDGDGTVTDHKYLSVNPPDPKYHGFFPWRRE